MEPIAHPYSLVWHCANRLEYRIFHVLSQRLIRLHKFVCDQVASSTSGVRGTAATPHFNLISANLLNHGPPPTTTTLPLRSTSAKTMAQPSEQSLLGLPPSYSRPPYNPPQYLLSSTGLSRDELVTQYEGPTFLLTTARC